MTDRPAISDLSPSDARGELLEAARAFAERRQPSDLLAQWTADATVTPSHLDLRTSTALDTLALDAAPDYEALLLSPVAPLGASSVVAPTSQDRVLTTMRSTEVVSDPTNVLALESARRLRADPRASVRLATIHQTLRMQPPPSGRGRSQHFRLFTLTDAGAGQPSDGFEVAAVLAQLAVYRRLFASAASAFGIVAERPTAIIATDDRLPALADRLGAAIAEAMPEVEVRAVPLEAAYYTGLRLTYGVHDAAGEFWGLVDLGAFDWVARLTANRRQRLVASAIGIQLLPLLAPR